MDEVDVRWKQRLNHSDIDLTLVGGSELTLHVLYRIADELDDLLLPYTFDLSI